MALTAAPVYAVGKTALVADLRRLLGEAWVLHEPDDTYLYAFDGSAEQSLPDAVVFPDTVADVKGIVRAAHQHRVPVVARGAGTGIAGGAIPACGGIVVSTSRMNRILEVDYRNQRAVVEPGVINADLSEHAQGFGFHFAPDPSSQKACTIGGNIATNAGGPHTLLYGVTSNHVLGVEFVTLDGEVVTAGGAALDLPGYDLTGLFCGSEGTLGIVTKAVVRLTHTPPAVRTMLAVFDEVPDCGDAVSGIVAAGIVPAALEMMDELSLRAIGRFVPSANLPDDSPAVLLAEADGMPAELDEFESAMRGVFTRNHAREVRVAASGAERDVLWLGRKSAFGAMGRISRDYYVQDGVIPRTTITQVLDEIDRISNHFDVSIANVFHAGDGNLHPLLLFDSRQAGAFERVVECGTEVLRACVAVGGMLSGEHGIGMEKHRAMPMVFSADDLRVMSRVRDVFNPAGLFNPGKVFPTPVSCGEINNLRRGDAPDVSAGH